MITPEQHAEIRRLYYGEHWTVGTIATNLGVHHETVRAAIADTRAVRRGTCRRTQLDPYLPFVRDTLAQYPRLRATRLHEMLRVRGYSGSATQVRRLVRGLRPQVSPPLYRRLTALIGDEAQIDWGSFGTIQIGHGTRPLSGFVMVLSYSRAVWALFTLDQTLESFLRGHVEAFHAIGGCARTLVYDNLKSAVLERQGTAIRFHPRLLELAGHYHFAVRPCTPGRGNEKGKVERQIRYLRDAFFAARTFRDVDDLNAQFLRWRDDIAHQRPHPEQRDRTVAEVFAEEQARLLPLPAHRFETELMRAVVSGKTPYVRFDRNQYSIPHPHARRPLTLLASATTVRLVAGADEIARHVRSYDTGRTIEDPAHLEGLLAATRQANASSSRDRLRLAVPLTATLFDRLAARGEVLRPHLIRLQALLDDYGPQELTAAVAIALDRNALGAGSISHLLETRRRHRGAQPPVPMILPDRPGVRDLEITPHRLESYDDLSRPESDHRPDREPAPPRTHVHRRESE
jgi:transposase